MTTCPLLSDLSPSCFVPLFSLVAAGRSAVAMCLLLLLQRFLREAYSLDDHLAKQAAAATTAAAASTAKKALEKVNAVR